MELADETFYDRRESSLDIKIENQQVRPTPDGYVYMQVVQDAFLPSPICLTKQSDSPTALSIVYMYHSGLKGYGMLQQHRA